MSLCWYGMPNDDEPPYWVQCANSACEAEGPAKKTKPAAIAAWNKRADGELAELQWKVGELREWVLEESFAAMKQMKALGLGADND
jgi:hypothetical protein